MCVFSVFFSYTIQLALASFFVARRWTLKGAVLWRYNIHCISYYFDRVISKETIFTTRKESISWKTVSGLNTQHFPSTAGPGEANIYWWGQDPARSSICTLVCMHMRLHLYPIAWPADYCLSDGWGSWDAPLVLYSNALCEYWGSYECCQCYKITGGP